MHFEHDLNDVSDICLILLIVMLLDTCIWFHAIGLHDFENEWMISLYVVWYEVWYMDTLIWIFGYWWYMWIYARTCTMYFCIWFKIIVTLLICVGNDSTYMLCTGMSMISVWTRFGYEMMYRTDRLPGYSMDYMGKEKEQIWMVQPDWLI